LILAKEPKTYPGEKTASSNVVGKLETCISVQKSIQNGLTILKVNLKL
jgi:hypothetical protein